MNKILIAVFDSERAAYEGLRALKDLHREGEISLYASSVIAMDASGSPSVLQMDDRGPLGTLVGVVSGSLLGLLAGPAGVVAGASVGAFGGMTYDLVGAGMNMDFVQEVAGSLTPGKAAVVADVDETWITPVESRLAPLGATTFRRLPDEIIDEALDHEAQAASAELDQLDAELDRSSGEARARVEKAIAARRRSLEAIRSRTDQAVDRQKAQLEARIGTLRAQRDAARERQREHIQARIDELNASFTARRARLGETRRKAADALDHVRQAVRH